MREMLSFVVGFMLALVALVFLIFAVSQPDISLRGRGAAFLVATVFGILSIYLMTWEER